ncbi:hypothetical protein Tco_1107199 [Tanacetum coccineum]
MPRTTKANSNRRRINSANLGPLIRISSMSIPVIGILQLVLLGAENRRIVLQGFKAYFDGFIDQVERVPFDISRQNMHEIPSEIYRQFVEQKVELDRNKKDVDDIKEEMKKFREEMNARPVRQENTIPIVVGQHYGFSDFSEFRSMQDGPSSFNGHENMGAPPNSQNPNLRVTMKKRITLRFLGSQFTGNNPFYGKRGHAKVRRAKYENINAVSKLASIRFTWRCEDTRDCGYD